MLFYLICLLIMGVPVLTMELAVGRASRKSAVLALQGLEKPKGQKWHIHGWFCLIGCCLLMMYYTTVTGWMVSYFGKFLTGTFHAGHEPPKQSVAYSAPCCLSPARWRSGRKLSCSRASSSAASVCRTVWSASPRS